MIPTSRYAVVAINIFKKLANKQETNTRSLYIKHKTELCKSIVELCVVNQVLINADIGKSLENVSLCLSYFGSKDFVTHECQFLLPFMVSLIPKVPTVEQLIEQMAELVETSVPDLLAKRYGNVFLHVFLNETDDVRDKVMEYLEKKTEMNGPALRKRNFQVKSRLYANYMCRDVKGCMPFAAFHI